MENNLGAYNFSRRSFLWFLVGAIVGFCFSEYFDLSISERPEVALYRQQDRIDGEDPPENTGRYEPIQNSLSIGSKLYNETRVLCWVMTHPANHKSKAIHVKRTWGKRCNKLLFMSTAKDPELDSIPLQVGEGRDYLWAKTKAAFRYIYEHHFNDADWFLKADDDTYIIVENLRYMLYPYSPETPIYFGRKFKLQETQGYMSGGAGYVLSKEAVRRFIVDALPNPAFCQQGDGGAEDAELGICLEKVNVTAGDSRDSTARGRFFPFPPEDHLFPGPKEGFWYWDMIFYKTDEGVGSLSDTAVSFHYVSTHQMYLFDYLIYELNPYGVINLPVALPKRLKVGEVLPPPIISKKSSDIMKSSVT